MLTKRNASEYIKGSIRIYRDTHARYCRGRAKLRWACPSSVVHSTKVGRLSWLTLSPRRSVSCIRVALHAASTRRLVASSILCYYTQTHVMRTFARSAHIPKRDT